MKQNRFETTELSDEVGFSTKELTAILIERMLALKTNLGEGVPFDVDETLEMLYQLEQELQ